MAVSLPDQTDALVLEVMQRASNPNLARDLRLWQDYFYNRDQKEVFKFGQVYTRAVGWLILYAPGTTVRDRVCGALHAFEEGNKNFFNLQPKYFNNKKWRCNWSVAKLYYRLYMNLIDIWCSAPTQEVNVIPGLLVTALNANASWNMTANTPVDESRRQEILKRDGRRCRASGVYDSSNLSEHPIDNINFANSAILQIAHILPRKLGGAGMNPIWATLEAFGYLTAQEIQNIKNDAHALNAHRNLFSLSSDRHGQFDRMVMWFEHKADTANDYTVEMGTTWRGARVAAGQAVNLANIDTNHDEPSRRFLALHAMSAKAFWLSGAADIFMKAENNPDDAEAIAAREALVREPTEADLEKYLKALESLEPVGGANNGRTNTAQTINLVQKPVLVN